MPEDLQSILSDPSLFNSSGDITTKEILKRYGDLGQNGGPRHQVETETSVNKSNDQRGQVPVMTRVDTDPSMNSWQNKESSVRHVQDNSHYGTASTHNTPPQPQWNSNDQPSPHGHRNEMSDNHEQRRDHRNSGWGRPTNGSVGVTGA